MNTLQATASKSDLLLNCQYPFGPEAEIEERETSEAAEYGTAFHKWMYFEMVVRPRGQLSSPCPPEFAQHISDSAKVLRKWMSGENPWKTAFRVVSGETHRATRFRVSGVTSRECDFDESSHTYALKPGEMGGTDDLLLESDYAEGYSHKAGGTPRVRVVLDYKSGSYEDYSDPKSLPQMLTLALQTAADGIAILHTPKDGLPVVYSVEVSSSELVAHAKKLRRALARIGDGSLRPGAHCKYCPAKPGCPTNNTEVAKAGKALLRLAGAGTSLVFPDIDLGKVHQLLPQADKLFATLRSELRERVRSGEVIERPDGKTLELVTHTEERISKKAFVDALGAAKAERRFEKLRAEGVLVKTEVEQLRAK